jgi:hypothetical protein
MPFFRRESFFFLRRHFTFLVSLVQVTWDGNGFEKKRAKQQLHVFKLVLN